MSSNFPNIGDTIMSPHSKVVVDGEDVYDALLADGSAVDESTHPELYTKLPSTSVYGLHPDGVDDFLTFPDFVVGTGEDFLLTGEAVADLPGSKILLGFDSSYLDSSYLRMSASGGLLFYIQGTASIFIEGVLKDGEVFTFSIKRVSNVITFTVNDVTETFTDDANFALSYFCKSKRIQNEHTSGGLSGVWTFDNGTLRTYDFNTSGESKTGTGQPILIDTTSGLNAVGSGFVGDDSEWVVSERTSLPNLTALTATAPYRVIGDLT